MLGEAGLEAGAHVEFILFLEEQADVSGAAVFQTKAEKGAFVFSKLTETAGRTQASLLAELSGMGVEHRSFWVANMVWVRGDMQALQAMAQRREVARIFGNPHVRFSQPEVPLIPQTLAAPAGIEWNIEKVRAPLVWEAGFTGQGVVIGGQDTGYEWTHPALINQYRGWDGTAADHDYNWRDAIHSSESDRCGADSPFPCDDAYNYHGTHTMGIMVGDDGGENRIGMAPGAKWIGCRNMDQEVGTPATYSECYQWFLAPTDANGNNPDPSKAPDIINNSWGCPPDEGCTEPDVLLAVVENVRAAGILTVHSAGNGGISCGTVNTPAAIYEASFTVGNTNASDIIFSSSSTGPVTVDGSGRLKPDITAPGANIRSSIAGSSYATLSGTSMAAPHVAGLAALLISAYPELRGNVDQIEELIKKTAVPRTADRDCGDVPGSSIPNNTYGWGRIDAWAALNGQTPLYFPIIFNNRR